MSQQHILNDAHFPLWFSTLENVVEESRHCLSHLAALSHNICNTAAATRGFFTGVKCIWQCNRLLGVYLLLKLKSLHSFRLRALSTLTTLWVSCFWVVPMRKHSWLQELARAPCCFHFLATKDSHTVSVGNSFSSCQRNCSFSVVCEQGSP